MRRSDLQVGTVYRGKSGKDRRIVRFDSQDWVIYEHPDGRETACTTVAFARWAIEPAGYEIAPTGQEEQAP